LFLRSPGLELAPADDPTSADIRGLATATIAAPNDCEQCRKGYDVDEPRSRLFSTLQTNLFLSSYLDESFDVVSIQKEASPADNRLLWFFSGRVCAVAAMHGPDRASLGMKRFARFFRHD
jgi:hypothetical protein